MKNCCNVHTSTCGPAPFFGRLLLSLIFIFSGLFKIVHFQNFTNMLGEKGVSAAGIIVFVALLIELLGGLSVLLGWFTRYGAILLMIFLIPTTIMSHDFWNFSGVEFMVQFSNFFKNVAIFGGLLLLASYGPGKWSMDACCERKHNLGSCCDKTDRVNGNDRVNGIKKP